MMQDQVLLNDWHVVAAVSELQAGSVLQKRLLGEDIVLWHNGEKTLAWQDLCPHRGARLSLGRVKENTLVCSYHGLEFNSEGECIVLPATPEQAPPARACVKTYHTQEKYGMIWVCMGTPQRDIPLFPDWKQANLRNILIGPFDLKASPLRAIENFIDPAHFPFVHHGVFATQDHPEIILGDLSSSSQGISFQFKYWYMDFTVENNENTLALIPCQFDIYHPLVVCLKSGIDTEGYFSIYFAVTPVEEEECLLWVLYGASFAEDFTDSQLAEAEAAIFQQDARIIESQRTASARY